MIETTGATGISNQIYPLKHKSETQGKIFSNNMIVHWFFLLPIIFSLTDASRQHHSVKNASKELDEFSFAFEDQLSILANETAILMNLFDQSISILNNSYLNQSEKIPSLVKRDKLIIDDNIRQHLYKVYRHLLIMIGTTSAAAAAAFSLGLTSVLVSQGVFLLLASIVYLLMSWTPIGTMFPFTKNVFSIFFAAISGLLIAPYLALPALPVALAGTALIFFSFTVAALISPSDSFLKWGGTISSVLLATTLLCIISIFFPALLGGGLFTAMIWTYLASFSFFVGHDTQLMIQRAKDGIYDHVADSVRLFMDLFNILQDLLSLLEKKS